MAKKNKVYSFQDFLNKKQSQEDDFSDENLEELLGPDAFDDDDVAAEKMVVRNMNGRTIIYDFSTMTAQHWRPGNPGNRRKTDIVIRT